MSSRELTMEARVAEADANRAAPLVAVFGGLAGLVIATTGLLHGVEPFATWYYQFAWYPFLLVLDGLVALTGAAGRKGEFYLLSRPRYLISLLGWSAVVWYFYELWNFRLQNWYYVNLPHGTALRWFSTAIAFATVFPAIFLGAVLLERAGLARTTRWRPFTLGERGLRRLQFIGIGLVALVLLWPRYFFPLVWGATTLLVEPWVYRRAPRRSLLHDLSEGNPGRLLRLLASGAFIGFVWEMLNINARTKWIYTVPFLENLKLFEMPVPGFLGFPPFAVECFVLWQALVAAGMAVPRNGVRRPLGRGLRYAALATAFAFCLAINWGMDRMTMDSYRPRLVDLGVTAPALVEERWDAYRLAAADPVEVAVLAEVPVKDAAGWVRLARLATLRGVGADGARALEAVGIGSVEQLASADSRQLVRALEASAGRDLVDARVRVWIRGARRALGLPRINLS